MALPTPMDGHRSTFSLIGGLAKSLKRFTVPQSSLDIGEEIRKLSEQIRNERKEKEKSLEICSRTDLGEGNASVSSVLATPSCSTVQSSCSNVNEKQCYSTDDTLSMSSSYTHTQSQSCVPSSLPNSDCGLIYQRESLLKLLSDDTDLVQDAVHESVSNTDTSPQEDMEHQQSIPAGTAILRIPEYIKAPARIFPVVIGSESYVLPYRNGSLTVVIVFSVVHAAGEFVVAKVTGCGPYDPSVPYPEGIMITLEDEIKVIQTKSPSEMTIDEQLQYHRLKVNNIGNISHFLEFILDRSISF